MKCELCGRPATHVDSVPSADVPGWPHQGECGYRDKLLCAVHAWERRQVATSRVRPLEGRDDGE